MTVANAEVRGRPFLRVLEIDVTDPDGNFTHAGWWTDPKTLRFTDEVHIYDSTSSTDPEYIVAVAEWGEIFQVATMGSGPVGQADFVATLRNVKIQPQEVQPTGASAVTNPPIGDEIKLSDLVRLYEWENAAVRIKYLWFETADRDQNSATFSEETVFVGSVAEVKASTEFLVLDITQDNQAVRSRLPGREVTDPPLFSGSYSMPVAYGNFGIFSREVPSNVAGDLDKAQIVGYRCPLAPIFPYERDGLDLRFVFSDLEGVDGAGIPDYAAGTEITNNSAPYFFGSHFSGQLEQGGSGTAGNSYYEDGATANTEATLICEDYVRARVYLFADRIVSSTGLTDPGNALDGDPFSYATLDLTSGTSQVEFAFPQIPSVGSILRIDDAILGWLHLQDQTGVSSVGSPAFDIGLWTQPGSVYLGTKGTLDYNDVNNGGLYRQSDATTLAGTITAGVWPNTQVYNWTWGFTAGTGQVVMKVTVPTPASAGDMLIVSAGIYLEVSLSGAVAESGKKIRRTKVGSPGNPVTGGRFIGGRGGGGIDSGDSEEAPADVLLWCPRSETVTDDAAGTITGTTERSLEEPAYISAHLLEHWGRNISASDLNLVGTGTTDSTAFGSFRHAVEDLDEWVDEVTGVTATDLWEAILVNKDESNVATQIDRLCKHLPMMVYKDLGGVYRCVAYPVGSPDSDLRLKQSDGTTNVLFHPGDPKGSQYGKVYTIDPETADITRTSADDLYNDIRVRYAYFEPNNEYARSVYANPDGYEVWDASTGSPAFVTSGDTLGDTIGHDTTGLCQASEDRYGIRRKLVIDAYTLHRSATATAFLAYLATRFSRRRSILSAVAQLEAYDMKPGHVIELSNDFNRVLTLPDYGETNWEGVYWMVQEIQHLPDAKVFFRAERLYTLN